MSVPLTALPQTEQQTRTLPPFRVLLHNDDVNTFDHVILRIVELTHLEEEEAVLAAIEAHKTGCALLLVTHKERAELYCEQFATYGINVSCEPDV